MHIQFQSQSIECPFPAQQFTSLSSLTTLETGGPARLFIPLSSSSIALEVLRWIKKHQLPFKVIGGGSNLLCRDEGFDGVVIQFQNRKIEILNPGEIYVESGVVWTDLVEWCVEKNWAGLECLAGIPGLVGAAPIQNIGAYGASLSDVCTEVYVYDQEEDELRWWTASECQWRYRWSYFKEYSDRYIIFALKFKLLVNEVPPIRYAQLNQRLNASHPPPYSLKEIKDAVIHLRRSKSMIWDPQDPNHRSAGSFFLNPLCTHAEFEALQKCIQQDHSSLSIPHWEEGNRIKVPAAWLIENAGCPKGFGRGKVGLSSKHTLAVINRGGATTQDLLNFAHLIQQKVYAKFGIILEKEPQLW